VPITESHQALGSWTLTLKADTPREILDRVSYLGHITVHTGRVDPRTTGDTLLSTSRYTGVVRGKDLTDSGHTLSGAGMAFWLGDEDGKGDVIETPVAIVAETFTQSVRDLLPASGAVTEGTFHAITGTYTGTHQYQSPRTAIDYVCTTMGGEWRVNGNATLDVGAVGDLYVTTPVAAIIRHGAGVDMNLRALPGEAGVTTDVEDFTTRVVLLAEGEGDAVATGSADIAPGLNPYLDLHGNPVKLTRLVSESGTDAVNAIARAQLQLNRFTSPRDALRLSTQDYDVKGTVAVGDYTWVFDPDIGLADLANEVQFRGLRLYPVKLRVIELTFPVVAGSTVAYRDKLGAWTDLSDYIEWESDATTVQVGGYSRSLSSSGEVVGSRPKPDSSVPGIVTWNEPFRVGVYQSPVTGSARGDVFLNWDRPNNTDSTPIIDGSHYEIRYRHATTPFYPAVWDQVEGLYGVWDNWEATGATWDSPIVYPETEWQTAIASFDDTTFRLQELIPSTPYEAQIRAVDLATPFNAGAWSALALWQTTNDNIPPVTPAPPEVQGNPMAVQMVHRLGAASGGTFNLDADLHHLELHGGSEPIFTPSEDTMLGKVLANYGLIVGEIPVVAMFQITSVAPVYFKVIAVDEAGNKSAPSVAVMETADLISDQYIGSLTASKITAGTMTSNVIVGGSIATGGEFSFPRVEMTSAGLRGLGSSANTLWTADTSTGKIMVNGTGGIEINDGRMICRNGSGTTIVEIGECADGRHGIQVYKDNGTRVARIGELASGTEGIELINDLGQLVRVDTLAFGMKSASNAAVGSRGEGAWGHLGSPSPVVTVTLGNSGRCIILLSCTIQGDGTSNVCNSAVSFEMSGPGTAIGANTYGSLWSQIVETADGYLGSRLGATRVFQVEGLSAGVYTVQMIYWSGAGTAEFQDRNLVVIPY
jgi:hypothetical protein